MHFSTLISAFIAISSSTLALAIDTNPYNTSAGALATNYPGGLDFYSACWKIKSCTWEPALDSKKVPIKDAFQCSCNKNPDKWIDLIWFYTKPNYTGDIYKGFGHYGECQDLPTRWKGTTESVQITSSPVGTICTIYTQPGCNGNAGAFTARDSTKLGDSGIKQFTGLYYKGVHSWKCVKK